MRSAQMDLDVVDIEKPLVQTPQHFDGRSFREARSAQEDTQQRQPQSLVRDHQRQ